MVILRNFLIGTFLLLLLTASSFAADNSHRIYGKIITVDGDTFEGLIRWDKNEVSWVDMLDATKDLPKKNLKRSAVEVRWLDLPGEEIPLENNSADTVLLTYTLCTISDWHTALRQIHRVMKPSGKLLFCEHGAAPDKSVLKWQNRINPIWKIIGGGCHLNRPISKYLYEGGFSIKTMETLYLPKTPRIAGFNYVGVAKKT